MLEEKQSIPIPFIINKESKNNSINNGFVSKLSLKEFQVDQSTSKVNSTKLGTKSIIIREDIISDLISIKNILNSYGIPLSCEFIDININNFYISDIAKLGLQINLNINSALTTKSDLFNMDYYVGPDYNQPFGNWFRLKVYAKSSKKNYNKSILYKEVQNPVDVYDIRNTFGKYPPKIEKIFKPLLDLTNIFENHGFKQVIPNKEFFLKSDNILSNWYSFYKPNKIKIGDTYIECLSRIYDNNGEPIWNEKNLKWDGEKFS